MRRLSFEKMDAGDWQVIRIVIYELLGGLGLIYLDQPVGAFIIMANLVFQILVVIS